MSTDKERRAYWVSELAKLSGSFEEDSEKLFLELHAEIKSVGTAALLDHLRSCGAMPEQYGHDSSEEKLYSKYTDALTSEALVAIGLKSTVLTARADTADVMARGKDFSLVADAKAFRLSRTAKNQKDFKVQAMDGWRNDLDYAAVVCPIYQLPGRSSQIYLQAVSRNVCILSYSHLAVLVRLSQVRGLEAAETGLKAMLLAVSHLHPSKSAGDYWMGINRALVGALGVSVNLWAEEKKASLQALAMLKEEALGYLNSERFRILALSHQEAINELVRRAGLDSRITQVTGVEHGTLLEA